MSIYNKSIVKSEHFQFKCARTTHKTHSTTDTNQACAEREKQKIINNVEY